MKKSLALVALVGLGAIASASLALQAVTLKLNVPVGQSYTTRINAVIDFNGQTITFAGKARSTVKAINPDGTITIEAAQTDSKIDFAGQMMEQPDSVSSATVDALGRTIKIVSDQATGEEYRLANVLGFTYPAEPVDVGSKYTNTLPGNPETGAIETKAEYEVLARETVNGRETFKIAFTHTETGPSPFKASGIQWIEIATGVPVKSEAKFENMPVQGMLFNGSWNTTLVD